jgi:hypothetical protein
MTKLVLFTALGVAGVALLHSTRPAPAPMARLQNEENRRFAELRRGAL